MRNYGPIVRIILRYVVGAGIMGSEAIGEALAANPDVVLIGSMVIGAAVEGGYALAKRRGWAT